MEKRIPIIIQARQSSKRLPSKVMTTFCGIMKMIEFQYQRLKTGFEYVIIATSTDKSDDEMCTYLAQKDIPYFRGSLDNVMGRLVDCYESRFSKASPWFVRVGGDDPLVSIEGIQWLLKELSMRDDKEDIGMIYSSYDAGMIYGCAVEIFNARHFKNVLESVDKIKDDDKKRIYREHTKPAFHDKDIKNKLAYKVIKGVIPERAKNNTISLSIDYPQDFLLCSYIANQLIEDKGVDYTHDDLIEVLQDLNRKLLINSELHDGFGE